MHSFWDWGAKYNVERIEEGERDGERERNGGTPTESGRTFGNMMMMNEKESPSASRV